MKPSVLAVSFFTSPGAVADNFSTLCSALATQSRLSILTSSLLRDRPTPGAEASCHVDVSKQRPLNWLSPNLWREVGSFARRETWDLLFIYSEHPLHVPVRWLTRARRTAFWCLDPTHHTGGRRAQGLVYELAKKALTGGGARVVVACNALKLEMCERYAVRESDVITLDHGVLDNLVFPDVQSPAVRDIDVLFFGRIYAYKGVDVLLDAVARLRGRGREARVVIAGRGPQAIAANGGVTVIDRYVPDRELAELVARARLVVMPYRDATGSQVPQTAFSYGTPVVASRVGCLEEYIEDGITGLLVPPGNAERLAEALERALTDVRLWETMSRNARERARGRFANAPLTARLLAEALA